MATSISQLNLDYDPLADRMLLSISTSDRQEFQIWITRRFLNILWPVLIKVLESDPAVKTHSESQTRKAVMSLRHEKAVSDTNFSEPYASTPAVERPLGDQPLLPASAKLRGLETASSVLALHGADGRGVELNTNSQIMHSLCSLLVRVAARAEWDLDLRIGEPPVTAPVASTALN